MKKRNKTWVYSEMVLLSVGFLLALWNGMYINSPALLFGILAAVFLFRAIERYYFKFKAEFFFNTVMVVIFIVLAAIPLMK
ncbi:MULTISPECIES: hypothetical protein [Fictibacillus]|uniref:DUF4181 domain-containing protein n=1 Tax=Fictibacillus terranigra TaxID=3058424 RepID=A0ABT8E7F9_9BACL|nr:hypothetical protein [Fictibacillus sp. CENA-BCM004]MDN4073853.1 hypothetical protein [Fictibacillus sp. CENA-BCM004]